MPDVLLLGFLATAGLYILAAAAVIAVIYYTAKLILWMLE